jgi:hypothetical protein
MSIPMPGHPIPEGHEEQVRADVASACTRWCAITT